MLQKAQPQLVIHGKLVLGINESAGLLKYGPPPETAFLRQEAGAVKSTAIELGVWIHKGITAVLIDINAPPVDDVNVGIFLERAHRLRYHRTIDVAVIRIQIG